MKQTHSSRPAKKRRGAALVAVFGLMTLLALAGASYVDSSTQTLRSAKRSLRESQATQLCEAGLQSVMREVWRPFRSTQKFTTMQSACAGASISNPRVLRSGALAANGRYTAGVIGYTQVNSYLSIVTIRAVGYLDANQNGSLDSFEPVKQVDAVARYELSRSQVFDYTYFVNNYGWMDGFNNTQLVVNGDMRANGNFNFLNGSPTVNGSVIAAANDKLVPPANGFVNIAPVKWTDVNYESQRAGSPYGERWRDAYNSGKHGNPGTTQFERWRDTVFKSSADWIQGGDVGGTYVRPAAFGTVIADATGTSGWQRTSTGASPTMNLLDTKPTQEVTMPDLSDMSRYQQLSIDFKNNPAEYQKATYGDGSPNPDYGSAPYIEVWNSTLNVYQRITDTNGRIAGSAVLIGTSSRPIKIYGPVNVDTDVLIKGYVQGQGTVYAGRNVHIVGSVMYKNAPDFRGGDPDAVEKSVEKKDMLGLAARGSVITGKTTSFAFPYPLYYMTPPFTKGRYDDDGNYIPPFNAMETDYTGRKRYQSVVSDTVMNSIAEGVNVIDAILYTNFVGGGNLGQGGGGTTFNGTIICKDESLVAWSLPLRMNYDNRIREKGPDQPPLIDLHLPRQPTLVRATWQDRGFSPGNS
ncbi:MAG: hypothetical protein IT207_04300 [Fimbriimonadaceae bacterium]|nr:hypothetical protein [Fimbriimonadaceae bacterium]